MKNTFLPITLFAAASAMLTCSTSLRASDMDGSIESSAAKSYVFKTYLTNDSIKIESKNGIVTLIGTVSDAKDRALAQDTVENLPGVKSVDDQLKISRAQPAEHSDTWISMKVKWALLFHRDVSATGTDVYVNDGVVTLEGKASSLAEKELTTEYAKDVDHVTAVKNDMTIAKTVSIPGTTGDKVDDASVTAEVKAALLSQRSTSALHPKVSTKDGVVTLSGIAKNDAEKNLVTKLVNDINGVAGVVNKMTEDDTLTTEVNAALQSEGATRVLHITVSTVDGVVSLSGMAKTNAGKSLAAKLATDIEGVTSVINNITVEVAAASYN